MRQCKYNLPVSKMAKVGMSRSILYANGIVDFKSDLRSMVAAFGAAHLIKLAEIEEAKFEAALKKAKIGKAAKPRIRIAAETRIV